MTDKWVGSIELSERAGYTVNSNLSLIIEKNCNHSVVGHIVQLAKFDHKHCVFFICTYRLYLLFVMIKRLQIQQTISISK
jgi:hypothetical protein